MEKFTPEEALAQMAELDAKIKARQANQPDPPRSTKTDAEIRDDAALKSLEEALTVLKRHKPNDRSEKDRYWAIAITDVEKALAVFKTYIRDS